jgi:hypothetical protein
LLGLAGKPAISAAVRLRCSAMVAISGTEVALHPEFVRVGNDLVRKKLSQPRITDRHP